MKTKIFLLWLILLFVAVISAILSFLLFKNSWQVIDLRKSMPKGKFLEASIVELGDDGKVNYVWLEKIPDNRMEEFEKGFKECVKNAKQFEGSSGDILEINQLRITTDKGKYAVYLIWTENYVQFNGLRSKEFRKVLFDFGLKTID